MQAPDGLQVEKHELALDMLLGGAVFSRLRETGGVPDEADEVAVTALMSHLRAVIGGMQAGRELGTAFVPETEVRELIERVANGEQVAPPRPAES